jgi:antitoxin component YwqK of YwqJK toxin-antitoxin module
VYFFDSNAEICSKENAYYIAKGTKEKDTLRLSFHVEKTGILVMEATYTDSTLAVKNGFFALYSEEGKGIMKKGNFINNLEDGYWIEWNDGHLTDSVLFENGTDILRITYSYYKKGNLSGRILNDSRTKTSELSSYDEDGNLVRYSKWINGSGDQTYYYSNGQAKTIETFIDKKIISIKNYKKDGTEVVDTKSKKKGEKTEEVNNQMITGAPSYPGGPAGFQSFFSRNFKPPQSLGRDGFSELVTVTFYLDKSGFAYNIRITGASNRDVETEVLAVFRRMAAWTMNGHQSFGPITYTISL